MTRCLSSLESLRSARQHLDEAVTHEVADFDKVGSRDRGERSGVMGISLPAAQLDRVARRLTADKPRIAPD